MKEDKLVSDDYYVDLLRVEGINSKGFGTIPKVVMKDRRLTLQAKGIYAYFCSYAGAGNRVFPSRNTILRDLGINVSTYYKHLDLLKKCDYIRVKQQKRNGTFAYNIYVLMECPNSKEKESIPCMNFSDTVHSDAEKPDTGNSHTNSIMKKQKQYETNSNQSIVREKSDDDILVEAVKANIEYNLLCDGKNDKLAQSILALIVEVLCSKEKIYRINGTEMSARLVKERFRQLNYSDIACTIDSVGKGIGRIHNPRNYLLTTLFNSKTTSEVFWKNEVAYTQKIQQEKERGEEKKVRMNQAFQDLLHLAEEGD